MDCLASRAEMTILILDKVHLVTKENLIKIAKVQEGPQAIVKTIHLAVGASGCVSGFVKAIDPMVKAMAGT